MVLLSRIYVGSINYDIREDTIRQAYSCFGPVKSVSLSYDPITQKHMGYAFLEFEYPEAAQLALAQNTGIKIYLYNFLYLKDVEYFSIFLKLQFVLLINFSFLNKMYMYSKEYILTLSTSLQL